MKKLIAIIILASISSLAYSNIRLPKIWNDNMVLQRDKPITVWGWADAGEKVSVQFLKQSKSTRADKNGKWIITLAQESAGGPYQLVLKGKNTTTINNILVGEVWVCSGQSNMEWPLRSAMNSDKEIQNANYPEIRQFLVTKSVSPKLEEDVTGGDWKLCTPENAGGFTAVGYFFAREVYNKIKVPIGLIHTSWGGTHSETWTSHDAFAGSPEFKDMIATMPVIDMDALAKKKMEALLLKLKESNVVPTTRAEADKWKGFLYDDSQWPVVKLPGLWERTIGDLDGNVWFRKTVQLAEEDVAGDAVLELGMIHDSDETFINGLAVGATKDKYNEKRKYPVKAGMLKKGKNVITIHVEDHGGGGGLFSEAQELKLVMANKAFIPLAGEWKYNVESVLAGGNSLGPNAYPTLLYNAMLNPLLNYSIRGALWYQGESNAGRAYQYREAFPLMIRDWRQHFKQGDFPFYFVQLANFNAGYGTTEKGSNWAELREAQTMTLALPNTGMAVITDIGNPVDIHPTNKQDVGKRLAAIALNNLYGQSMVYSGPVYQSMKSDGNKIRISFTQTGSGLVAKDKYGYLKGFEVAGSDQKFHYAKAWIEGSDVVVLSDAVTSPVAVRYAWADNPEDANLYNIEGFPASSFRSDNWKSITEGVKFKIQ